MRPAAQGATWPRRGAPMSCAAAGALAFCALFFSDGSQLGPLVWIGGAALVLAALGWAAVGLGLVAAPALPAPAAAFLACLAGLVVWCGVSTLWSIEPSSSWSFTNRTLAYLGFAALGLLVGGLVPRAPRGVASALAVLLALVLGWALLAKAVPALYPDYGRVARLRSPVEYWNELALLCDVAIALGLWLAAPRARAAEVRAAGAVLLFGATLCVLLTYSRFGIALAAFVATAWLALERERVESLAALALGAAPGAAVFGIALALPGITNDGEPRSTRVRDGWIFALVVVAAAALVWLAARAAGRLEARRPLREPLRARVDRLALHAGIVLGVAGVALLIVFGGRIWHSLTSGAQVTNGQQRLTDLGSSNRWTWWQQAWHAFLRHPGGGTGAGTFDLTNTLHRKSSIDVAVEPHNVPLQFLSETGIVGLLLWLGAAAGAALGVVRARRAATSDPAAVTALGLGLGAWLLHMVVDIDWSYVAVCGPLLLVAGALLAGPARGRLARRRPLLAIGGVAFALVAVYSLAAPWLADRQLDRSYAAAGRLDFRQAAAHARRAHSYDPLSPEPLLVEASLEPNAARARELYRKAVSAEPLNPDAWYQLGQFEYQQGNWRGAYRALDRSWGLYHVGGPLSVHCSLLDRVRPKVTGYGPKCPAGTADR